MPIMEMKVLLGTGLEVTQLGHGVGELKVKLSVERQRTPC